MDQSQSNWYPRGEKVNLQASVDDLVRRVYERGIEFERNISEQFLKRVADPINLSELAIP